MVYGALKIWYAQSLLSYLLAVYFGHNLLDVVPGLFSISSASHRRTSIEKPDVHVAVSVRTLNKTLGRVLEERNNVVIDNAPDRQFTRNL